VEELKKIIIEYLKTFFMIKQLSISNRSSNLCWKRQKMELRSKPLIDRINHFIHKPLGYGNYMMRDGAVRVVFEVVEEKKSDDNWFGIYFRSSHSPFMGSYLLFVRPNGRIELAVYPGPHNIETEEICRKTKGEHTLLIEFDNDQVNVDFDGKSYFQQQNILTRQTRGYVHVAAWNADIDVHSVEMICRDTIDWS